jgi:hypothetical protein
MKLKKLLTLLAFVTLAFVSCDHSDDAKPCFECEEITFSRLHRHDTVTTTYCDKNMQEIRQIEENGTGTFAGDYNGIPVTVTKKTTCLPKRKLPKRQN